MSDNFLCEGILKIYFSAKQEGIPYKTVKQLRLDSLNILKIENMWQFTSLTKLQMDSNMIEKIEGVDILGKFIHIKFRRREVRCLDRPNPLGTRTPLYYLKKWLNVNISKSI